MIGQSPAAAEEAGNPLHNIRIFVVDDEPVNLQVLRNNLFLAGIQVETASGAFEALEKLETGYLPDIILLDIMMPRMNGYELCKIIRKSHSISEMPIIFLTAKDRTSDLIEGLSSGANDYISKPFSPHELIARVNTQIALKKAVKDREKLVSIRNELRIAREIQQAIIPKHYPLMSGLDIQGEYIPMEAVGGDFFDFHLFDGKRIGIVIADVSGHGIPAAIVAAMVKVAFSLSLGDAHRPDRVLETIQQTLIDKLGNNFLTAGYVYIDVEAGTISSSRAGHLPVLVFRKSEKKFYELYPAGGMISRLGENLFETTDMKLAEGDRIILFTDGIVEITDRSDVMFETERLMKFIERNSERTAKELCRTLVKELTIWAGKDTFNDDLTLLIIDIT
ncbi:MAG: SpoIIE family protein phosphatase [Spirochaetes bacterium]|nr:SpoIIE family protein phosphatase [Spirochaetota bacterium]